MFQKIKKIGPVLAMIGLSGLLLASCDINRAKTAFKKINLVIGLQPITTTVSGVFTDAKTGNLIPSVTLSFEGSGAGDVIDMFSDPISQQTFSGGFATFGISNNVTPSPASPDSFRVVAKAPGYVTAYQKVILRDTTHYGFAMTMVNTSNPPAGVNSGSNTSAQTTSSGAVAQSYSVQTQASADAPTTASMSVPATTVMTDANGTPLTGNITTNMSYYSDSTQAIQQLPGNDGTITTGFAQITITDGSGHTAAHFSKPVTVNFGVSSQMINPATGMNYKSGDSLEVDSYDEHTGVWKYEGMAYLTGPNSSGNLDASFPIHHLSSYRTTPTIKYVTTGATLNVDWSAFPKDHYGYYHVNIYFHGVVGGKIVWNKNFKLTIFTTSNNGHIAGGDWFFPGGWWIGYKGVPNIGGYIEDKGYKYPIANFASGSYSFKLKYPPSTINVTFTLKPTCSDPSQKVHVTSIPTSEIYYKADKGSDTWHDAGQPKWNFDKSTNVLSGGTLTVDGLVNGDSYTFKTAFDGKTYTKDVTITGTSMTESQTISGSYCK